MLVHSNKAISEVALSDDDFKELIDKLLALIEAEHNSKLDKIDLDINLVPSMLERTVKFLRNAPINTKHVVKPKETSFQNILKPFLKRDRLVTYICEKAREISPECHVSVDPDSPLFVQSYWWKPWSVVKSDPDAGLDREWAWFSVRLK